MKRITKLSISFLLVLALALAVCGCGETSKAKEYMEKGDELSSQAYSLVDEWDTDDITSILTSLGLDITAATTGAWDSSASEVTAEIDKLIDKANAAQDEYEKILGLSGVDDYREYAELMIKAMDNYIPVLEGLKDLLNKLGKAASENKSLTDTASAWYKDNKSIQNNILKAATFWGEAALLKKNKNLAD